MLSLLLALTLSLSPSGWTVSWPTHPDNRVLQLEYWCFTNDRMDFQAVNETPTDEGESAFVRIMPHPKEHPDGVGCGLTLHLLRGDHPLEPHRWYVAESLTIAWP